MGRLGRRCAQHALDPRHNRKFLLGQQSALRHCHHAHRGRRKARSRRARCRLLAGIRRWRQGHDHRSPAHVASGRIACDPRTAPDGAAHGLEQDHACTRCSDALVETRNRARISRQHLWFSGRRAGTPHFGRNIGRLLREDVARPLGADVHIGLPSSEHHRVAEFLWPGNPAKPNSTATRR